ncbi:MAG TPA: hypothetical protein VJL58_00575 [Pyrinomonadaceae bacterium]|nr:hypothetical protein [Pyrinomonadaceae bacterium]
MKCNECKFRKELDGRPDRCLSRKVAAVNVRFLPVADAREICKSAYFVPAAGARKLEITRGYRIGL